MLRIVFRVALFALPVLVIIAFLTNPTRDDFAEKIKTELEKEVNAQTDNPALKYIAEIGLEFSKQVADKMMVSENYYICSIFKVSLPDGEYTYLGAFNHFYPLQDKDPLEQIRNLK